MTSTDDQISVVSEKNSSPPDEMNDPPGPMHRVEKSLDDLNLNMGKLTSYLGTICQHLPTGDNSCKTRERPPGLSSSRKRQRSESFSSVEEGVQPSKSRRDEDSLSLAASDEDIEALMEEASGKPDAGKEGSKLEPEDDMLKELTSPFQDEDKTGPAINEQLAEVATKRWGKKLAQEKVTALLAKYDPPENCSAISVTRVNPEIWQSLNSSKRKTDLRLANLQQALQKATFATLATADKLLTLNDSTQKREMLSNSIDVVAILGHAASELSIFRREQMKPALKPEFHALCSADLNVTSSKFLFGEDLAKQVRDAKETNHIGNTVGSYKPNNKGFRRDQGKRDSRGSGSRPGFLGKGFRSTSRKKHNYQKTDSPAGKK